MGIEPNHYMDLDDGTRVFGYRVRNFISKNIFGFSQTEAGGFIGADVKIDGRRYYGSILLFDSFIGLEASVFENASILDKARIYGDAQVFGNAIISGSARVYGDSMVYGNARVADRARVYGDAEVYEDAYVYECARVSDYARVFGNAIVNGDQHIKGETQVFERPTGFWGLPW